MSIRKDLFNRIASMESDSEGWIVVSTAELADSLDREPNLISKMLNSLKAQGNIEAQKDDESGKVKAVRILRHPRGYRNGRAGTPRASSPRQAHQPGPGRPRLSAAHVSTPNTDEYAQAKAAYEKAAPALGPYASVEWHENPLAEEALALKQRNDLLAAKVAELSSQNGSMTRELEYLRKAQDQTLRKGLREAGVLVEHGS